jgi:DNA-binding XRE family transcriptional regulator
MTKKQFSGIRKRLGKTQKQMAQLLGVSIKAVQSFEQGWRNVPVHVERQVLFLLARHHARRVEIQTCWELTGCHPQIRERCPAWEFNTGDLCWFINGTICQGAPQKNWREKIVSCRSCEVFRTMIPKY